MSGLKKRQTTHHLGWASSRGGRPGVGGKGQSGSARPGGLAATGSAQGRAAWPRASASRRGPAVPGSGERGFTDGGRARGGGGAAAGARPGGGPAGAGLPSRAPLLLEPREGGSRTALETREAAPWSLSRRVPGEASASRPSRASRASYSGDEERSGHPAPIAAAAGRLHCLTITRAGFSPRIPRLLLPFSHCGPCLCLFFWNVLGVLPSVTVTCKSKRHISLEDKSSFLKIKKGDCWSDNLHSDTSQGRTDTPGPEALASWEAPV
ncbi:zinc finger protein 664 isoform X3 [Hippopotamus amphibius kiboko]|uniref:zinc finger protein 664 isoform X3 n=1 Tax=Hippopotamus amphibius kiboko TaxID=575201 RepID=UPI002595ECA6|nr:zinc finger protein 664 isoform X3 [Hippopotamus amphibius kiboko]